MFLLMVLACVTVDPPYKFAGGGTPLDDTGYEADDTDDTGEDTGSSGDSDAPQLNILTAEFTDVPNVGVALTVSIAFDDPNESLVGGVVHPTFTDSSGGADSEAYNIGDYYLGEIDEAFVDPDSGELFFAVVGFDETETFDVSAYVVDSEGRTSNTVMGSAAAY